MTKAELLKLLKDVPENQTICIQTEEGPWLNVSPKLVRLELLDGSAAVGIYDGFESGLARRIRERLEEGKRQNEEIRRLVLGQ